MLIEGGRILTFPPAAHPAGGKGYAYFSVA